MPSAKTFAYPFYRSKLWSIDEVKQHMTQLNDALSGTYLHNLIAFNHTYYIITKNVHRMFGRSYFEHENIMEQVDINFASHYFDALHNYLESRPTPEAWNRLFASAPLGKHYQFVYMALGVNAHVNNDLPHALLACADDRFEKDYFKVNAIIKTSLPEVVWSLRERSLVLGWSEKLLLPLYTRILLNLITNWRGHAWVNYHALRQNPAAAIAIEQQAGKIAERLLDINRIPDLHRVRWLWQSPINTI